ncbi:kinase-like protein [Dothidotthia symphoricarpi CBS 119687]|uniref:non-specific serine/threonine protein kinase n=1 Tax=Dothidotthia symphoricarpi CBS 119687 TaxID=1392245 RepID=A0A6A5ZZ29_9PLEO|nr:kinase-like protein [Dothidotthia symphoricarpi CBS 119687]KAF2124275.1 kinase-like protein [Dothidotthia symphoricarpi CBS 119687]
MPNNPADGFPGKHTFKRQVQKGSEGVVNAWTHTSTGVVVAVKVIKSKAELPREVEILTKLPLHDSVIMCLAFYDKQPVSDTFSIVLEYCPLGDLYDLYWTKAMVKNRAVVAERTMWTVLSQLLSAVAFLHEGIGCRNPLDVDYWKPVVHRDIKMENILVKSLGSKDDWSEMVIKLGDFGLSAWYDPTNPIPSETTGTPLCWPPETTWENKTMTPAGDVWAVGTVIHEMAHGFKPVVDMVLTKKKWYGENVGRPYPEHWHEATKKHFWFAKSPRKVLPINVDSHALDPRSHRPTPKYSNSLNECMMMALTMEMDERPGSGVLSAHVEEAYAEYLFQELRIENERETAAAAEDGDEAWYV